MTHLKASGNDIISARDPKRQIVHGCARDCNGRFRAGYFTGGIAFLARVVTGLLLFWLGFERLAIADQSFPGYAWATNAGGSGSDVASAAVFGPSGVTYMTGRFQGTATFGSTHLTSVGQDDIFLLACDNSGQVLWAIQAGGAGNETATENDSGEALAVDPAGNILLTGYFRGSATFGSKIVTGVAGLIAIFVAKFDPTGHCIWVRQASGEAVFGLSCAVDKDGDVYISGTYYGTAQFWDGFSISSEGAFDGFAAKISTTGNMIWLKTFGSSGYSDHMRGICVDSNLNCFVSGVSNGLQFIAKFDAAGNRQWLKQSSAQGSWPTYSVVPDDSGGVFFAGSFSGLVNFDGHLAASEGGDDAILARYDSSGSVIWAKAFGGSGNDVFWSIARDNAGNVLTTGSFQQNMSIGGSALTSQGGTDILVAKFAPDGSPVWAGATGGSGDDLGENIAVDPQGRIAVSGRISNTVGFGTFVLTSVGGTDAFVARLGDFPEIVANPQSQTVDPGDTVELSVAVIGRDPLTYEWRRNGIPLADATNTSLILTNIQYSQSGEYSLFVSNALGTATSSSAVVIVNDPGDFDSDGLPNWWESLYDLNPNNPSDAATRPSGDQLTYLQKFQFGLNPLTTDTDRDTLADYDELFLHGTNPLTNYTDGDEMPDAWEKAHGLNPRVNDAADDFDGDEISNLAEYSWNLTHPDQLDPVRPFSLGGETSDFELVTGVATNRFYYDRNDRLLGAEYSRGLAIAYQYDGNGNIVRQTVLARANETNGLPVLWQFLNGLANASPYADTDGDGWSTYQEWKAGTNPMDSNSVPSPCVTAPAGLVAWWPGDGNANDIQGTNHGTLMNGATFATGKVGQAFSFDGVDDYVVVPDSEAQRPTNITIEGWFKVPSGGQDFILVSKYAGNWAGWTLLLRGTLKPEFELRRQPDQTGVDVPSSVPIQLGQWTHLAGTYDGTNGKIYVNGALQGTASFPGGYTPSAIQMTIGRASHYEGGFAQGQVDEFSIYNRVLTETEINSIYAAGSAGKCTFDAQTLPQTAPAAAVLPQSGTAGTLVSVRIRLWDAEGNASTPFLQYQLPGATNWQEATGAFLDGAPYGSTNKVPALPTGSDHVLTWNASAVFTNAGPTNLWFRARAQDMTLLGDWSAPMPYTLTVTADTDGDGLPDDWEMQYLGTPAYGPTDDPDHDGMNNMAEYLAGTNPNDPNSKLAVTLHVTGTNAIVAWQAGTNTTQYLQRRPTVDNSTAWQDILTNPAPAPTSGSYTDQLGTNAMQFYRMKVER